MVAQELDMKSHLNKLHACGSEVDCRGYYHILREVPLQFLNEKAVNYIINTILYQAKPIEGDC